MTPGTERKREEMGRRFPLLPRAASPTTALMNEHPVKLVPDTSPLPSLATNQSPAGTIM